MRGAISDHRRDYGRGQKRGCQAALVAHTMLMRPWRSLSQPHTYLPSAPAGQQQDEHDEYEGLLHAPVREDEGHEGQRGGANPGVDESDGAENPEPGCSTAAGGLLRLGGLWPADVDAVPDERRRQEEDDRRDAGEEHSLAPAVG